MADVSPSFTYSERVYKVLLTAYPKDFRREYGSEMVRVFGDLCREERRRTGVLGLAVLWVRTVLDLLWTATAERTRTTPGATLVIPVVGSPRMIRWGGVAAIGGAILSFVATVLTILSVAFLREPIFNSPEAHARGGSDYSLSAVLFHPSVSTFLSTVAVLLFGMALLGLYALVSRRSGKLALWGGSLLCLFVTFVLVRAAVEAYRLSVVLGGRFDGPRTSPFLFVGELLVLAFLFGTLILSTEVARTWALGRWSLLPLVLMFVGTVLRLGLIHFGFPVQDLPLAVREGTFTLLIVHSPGLITNVGWILLGYIMLRRSGDVLVDATATAISYGGGARE